MTRTEVSPWVIRGLYLFALVLVLSPFLDLLSTVWPLRPGELPWRYGFLGLAAGYLTTPIFGLCLALGVAHVRESAVLLRALGVLMMVGAVGVLAAMAVFLLDVVQMRSMRVEEMQQAVLVGGALQEVKYGATFLVLAVLGFGAFKTGGRHASRQGAARRDPGIVSPSS